MNASSIDSGGDLVHPLPVAGVPKSSREPSGKVIFKEVSNSSLHATVSANAKPTLQRSSSASVTTQTKDLRRKADATSDDTHALKRTNSEKVSTNGLHHSEAVTSSGAQKLPRSTRKLRMTPSKRLLVANKPLPPLPPPSPALSSPIQSVQTMPVATSVQGGVATVPNSKEPSVIPDDEVVKDDEQTLTTVPEVIVTDSTRDSADKHQPLLLYSTDASEASLEPPSSLERPPHVSDSPTRIHSVILTNVPVDVAPDLTVRDDEQESPAVLFANATPLQSLIAHLFLMTVPAIRKDRPIVLTRWFWGAFRRSVGTELVFSTIKAILDARRGKRGGRTATYSDLCHDLTSTMELWIKEGFGAKDAKDVDLFHHFIDEMGGPIPYHRRMNMKFALDRAVATPAQFEWPFKALVGFDPNVAPIPISLPPNPRHKLSYYASSPERIVAFSQQLTRFVMDQYHFLSLSDTCTNWFLNGRAADSDMDSLVQLSREISCWAEYSIREATTESERNELLEFWIRVAAVLRNLRNFFASHAVSKGLHYYWRYKLVDMSKKNALKTLAYKLKAPRTLSSDAVGLYNQEQYVWYYPQGYFEYINDYDKDCTITIPFFAFHRREWLKFHKIKEETFKKTPYDLTAVVNICSSMADEMFVLESHRLGTYKLIPDVYDWILTKLDHYASYVEQTYGFY